MINGLDSALHFADNIIRLYIMLLILPYLFRFIIVWFHSVLGFIFRFGYEKRNSSYQRSIRTKKIGKLVSLIFLPGTLLRVVLIIVFLKLRGWVMYISYPSVVGNLNRSLSDERRSGFFISMRPHNKRTIRFKEIIQVSLIGYIPLFVGYYMWKTRGDQIDFLIYLSQGNMNIFWIYFLYYYLLLAIFIGGAPIPEETMLPIYFVIGKYPHLIIGIICAYIISFLISLMELGYLGFEGKRVAETFFLLFSAILYFKVVLDEEKNKITKRELDDYLLKMELIELV
ncbi:MAG: hypothetical protein HeimC2_39530 [Candidatus Heimdallarchaeota archaeon LC_2]|nr:MAG: hypothetical protein HeimC2_39530 [Candidatus Heimdallarchaeota archaeon LC_2]